MYRKITIIFIVAVCFSSPSMSDNKQPAPRPLVKMDDLPKAEMQCFILSELVPPATYAYQNNLDISSQISTLRKILDPEFHQIGQEMVEEVYSGKPIDESFRIKYFSKCLDGRADRARQPVISICYQMQRELDKYRKLKNSNVDKEEISKQIEGLKISELEKYFYTNLLNDVYSGKDDGSMSYKISTWAGCTLGIK